MENVDWRHLTTGSSGLTGQARSQLNRMLCEEVKMEISETHINVIKKFLSHLQIQTIANS